MNHQEKNSHGKTYFTMEEVFQNGGESPISWHILNKAGRSFRKYSICHNPALPGEYFFIISILISAHGPILTDQLD